MRSLSDRFGDARSEAFPHSLQSVFLLVGDLSTLLLKTKPVHRVVTFLWAPIPKRIRLWFQMPLSSPAEVGHAGGVESQGR